MAKLTTKNGTELTQKVLDDLAAEAEAGYDLSKAIRRTRGRPSLSVSGKSPTVQIRLDKELADALRSRAAREKRSLSAVARDALRSYVEQT